MTVDGTILSINRTVSGLRVDQTIGTKIFDYILPEYHLKVRECVRQVIQTGEVDSYEIAGTDPDSTTSWYRTRVGPIMRNDEIVALSLITTDIKKKRLPNRRFGIAKAIIGIMYENAPIAYFRVDKEGTIQMANRRAGELLGYGLERLVGRPFLELYKDTPSGKEKALRVLQQFQSGREIHDEELEMCDAEGQTIWVSLTVLPLRNSEGEVIASRSMAIDITSRKRTEREFIRLERLQALGEMGQGVAHNFNNLQVGVLGYA